MIANPSSNGIPEDVAERARSIMVAWALAASAVGAVLLLIGFLRG